MTGKGESVVLGPGLNREFPLVFVLKLEMSQKILGLDDPNCYRRGYLVSYRYKAYS